MLAIALMLSVLRLDWTGYLREDVLVTNSRFHDTIMGPSVGLTETQFHNLYNSAGQTHSKNIITDSFYYNRSVFRELDSLYEGISSITSSRRRVEVTTFLLDQLESNDRSNGQVMVAQQPTNPTNNHVNNNINSGNLEQPMHHHDSESDEGFEEMDTGVEGAVGQSHSVSPTPSDELSIEVHICVDKEKKIIQNANKSTVKLQQHINVCEPCVATTCFIKSTFLQTKLFYHFFVWMIYTMYRSICHLCLKTAILSTFNVFNIQILMHVHVF